MEYMTEVRNFAIRSWFPEIAGEVGGIAAQAGMPAVIDADQYGRLAPEIDRSPAVAVWKRLMRSQQQLACRSCRTLMLPTANTGKAG